MTAMTIAFDTLKYANRLKTVGVPTEQAEAQAEAIAELVTETLVTKQDLRELESHIIIKLGSVVIASTSLLLILIKLFHL